MDLQKIKDLAKEISIDRQLHHKALIYLEINHLDLSDEDLEIAFERILEVYYQYDYATIMGVALAYAYWFEHTEDKNDVEDWIGTYELGDWR